MTKSFLGFLGLVLACLCCLGPLPCGALDRPPVALVYHGPVADPYAAEALGDLLAKIGLEVRYLDQAEEISSRLAEACLLAIGGTDDNTEPLRQALIPGQRDAIQEFVRSGGRFVGICGGGYLASRGWDEYWGPVEGLGLVPALTDYYGRDLDPRIINVDWLGTRRLLYYQGGPVFFLGERDQVVERVATYEDGSLAALFCALGQGKVLAMGPHPEADITWLEEDHLWGTGWTPTEDLALAVLQDLISDRPLVESFPPAP